MATYSLSGSGTQTLTTGVTALHVTISTLPAGAGHGLASPTDYWGIGSLRPGNATAFWEPFVICGGPQWLPVPYGTTRLGYSFATSAVVSVAEVFNAYPLSVPLAGLPDVALSSPADAQVLAYQASSSKWINATPASGGGSALKGCKLYLHTDANINNSTWTRVPMDTKAYDATSMGDVTTNKGRITIATAGKYLLTGLVNLGSSTTLGLRTRFWKNNTVAANFGNPLGLTSESNPTASIVTVADFAASDYVELQAFQSSGAARTLWGDNCEVTATLLF